MKRGLKRLLSSILCSTLIVTTVGCSSTGKDNKMGRYLEERYEFQEGVYAQEMVKLDNGNIAMVGYNEAEMTPAIYTSEDGGKTWTSVSIEIPKVEGKEVSVGQCSVFKNGETLISYYIMDPMPVVPEGEDGAVTYDKEAWVEPEIKYLIADANGATRELDVDFKEESTDENMGYGSPYRFKSASNGDIFYISPIGDSIVQVDGQTWEEKFRYQANDWIDNFTIVDNSLILWQYSGIVEYDIETGEEIGNLDKLEEETVKANSSYYPQMISADSKEKIYYYSVLGLYAYDLKTEKSEMLIDGSLSTFGNRDSNLVSFIEKENGEFLTLFNEWSEGQGGTSLINFHYDATVPSVPDEQIRVYSLIENDTIRQAVSAFTKNNPDTYVKYEVGLTWGDGVTEADALKTLNTEIMAGNGPDIILLDNLPAQSYIEKGLLEDISDIIAEYTANDELFKGMQEAYSVDGKIYQFPTSFKFPMLVGEKELISKITDFESLANVVKELGAKSERRIFSDSFSPRSFVYSMYYLYGNDWLNEDNTINEEALTKFFTLGKDIYTVNTEKQEANWKKMEEIWNKENTGTDSGIKDNMEVLPDEDTEIPDKGEMYEEDPNMNLYELSYSLTPYAYVDSLLWDEEPAQLIYGGIQDSWSYGSLITVLLNNKELDYKVLTRGDENILAPIDVVGINAKSENKEVAKKFVKEMISQQTQSTGWRQGLPVNKASLLKQFEMPKDEFNTPEFDEETKHYVMGSMGTVTPDGQEKTIKQYYPNQDDINRLVTDIEKLNVAPTINKTLLIEVAKQFETYVNGECTVEEAVSTIVDNLDLYLAE